MEVEAEGIASRRSSRQGVEIRVVVVVVMHLGMIGRKVNEERKGLRWQVR